MEGKERPISFSATWVRAILAGRKSQTRRVCDLTRVQKPPICRLGGVGDRLWVKETWSPVGEEPPMYAADFPSQVGGPWKPSRFMPRGASRIDLRITAARIEALQLITEADVLAEGIRAENGQGSCPGPGYESQVNANQFHVADASGICACEALSPITKRAYDLVLPPALCAWREAWDKINSGDGRTWDDNPSVWVISFDVERIGAIAKGSK